LECGSVTGCTFWFEVDLAAGEETIETPKPLDGSRVLVAHKNQSGLAALEHILAGWNCEVTAANDEGELLSELESGCYETVIVDAQIGDLNWTEFVSKIDRKHRNNAIEVILLSSIGGASMALPGVLRERITLLNKPAKRAHLYRALTKTRHRRLEIPAGNESGIPTGKPLQGLNVLLAEDNLVNQKVALNLLDRLGAMTVLADNGKQAIERFEQGGFDLILMDCHMPEIDGYEAIPIVAMTANAMQGDRDTCIASGMDDYTTKPVRAGELVAAIERSLYQVKAA
jgi:CheY-like chemotaxis protein